MFATITVLWYMILFTSIDSKCSYSTTVCHPNTEQSQDKIFSLLPEDCGVYCGSHEVSKTITEIMFESILILFPGVIGYIACTLIQYNNKTEKKKKSKKKK